jgi:hypothetical protein
VDWSSHKSAWHVLGQPTNVSEVLKPPSAPLVVKYNGKMEQELTSIELIDNSPIDMSTLNFNYNVKSPMEDTSDVSLFVKRNSECASVDEMTIGFQGSRKDKRRITYKAEGNGSQCDALCQEGYYYQLYFRNDPAPKKYVALGLLPLYARGMWLFDSLVDDHHQRHGQADSNFF